MSRSDGEAPVYRCRAHRGRTFHSRAAARSHVRAARRFTPPAYEAADECAITGVVECDRCETPLPRDPATRGGLAFCSGFCALASAVEEVVPGA